MTAPTCPACSAAMKQRSGSRGPFYGCSKYPTCRATRPISAGGADAPVAPGLAPDDAPELEIAPESAPAPVKLPSLSYAETTEAYTALMARLDSDQRSFVAWSPSTGNTRCIASAGSGKTTSTGALVSRLVREGEVNPGQLVATTFTSKAGKELAERLNKTLPPGALDQMRVGTFHGLALRALRGHDSATWRMDRCLDIGKRAPGVPSAAKLWAMALSYAGPSGMPGTGAEGLGLEEPDIRAYALAVDVARSKGLFGTALEDYLHEHERESGLPYLERAWRMITASKAAIGAWDFADALQAWEIILEKSTPTPGTVVIVDEAQDNSEIQLSIARLLSRAGSLLLVGDIRQSIYSWRGAYPDMFAHADTTIGAKTAQIRNNYRSCQSIVALGNRIAAGKSWSIGDAANAARSDAGTIAVSGYADPESEAREVAAKISRLAADGAKLDDVAILCRTNAASGAFEAGLVAANIPCVVVGGQPFFKRYEVQNALAYVRLSVSDDLEAFARIVNKPRRYLGAKFVAQVSIASGSDLIAKIESASGRVNSRQRDAARELAVFLSALRAAKWPETVDMIAKLLGSGTPESNAGEADADRSGLVAAVASLARGFDSAEKFLDFASRCAGEVVEAKASDGGFELPVGRVTISTIHKSKGLEWTHVFVSASAGTFPHARATGDRYDEEERLFYVACTRAKDTLSLTYSDIDLRGRPAGASEFLGYVSGGDDTEPPTPPSGGEPAPKTEPPPEPSYTEDVRLFHLPSAQVTAIGVTVETAPAPDHSALAPVEGTFGEEAWGAAIARAEQETADAPREYAPNRRYVQPTIGDFERLLGPLDFLPVQDPQARQVVFVRLFNEGEWFTALHVYTTIPLDSDTARDVGEDSIKVAAVWAPKDGETRPLHRKLPYACRTRNWRVTLLHKIADLTATLTRRCPRCGAPVAERRSLRGGTEAKFYGCVRWNRDGTGCNGTLKVEG